MVLQLTAERQRPKMFSILTHLLRGKVVQINGVEQIILSKSATTIPGKNVVHYI